MTGSPQRLTVPEGGGGIRLDSWLAGEIELSRSRVAGLIGEGKVLLNGEVPRKGEVVQPGDRIEVTLPAPEPSHTEAEELPLDIVHEDRHLVVVNKAAGMVVHPSAGHAGGTLVNALLHHVRDLSGIGGTLRPGIVHRLDRDTSGLLVVAKDDTTHQALSLALRRREVRRIYLAAAWGHLPESHLRVQAPIGRDPRDRKRMGIIPEGRTAITHLRVRERWRSAELLDVGLETGRTHQIRVHLEHIGHPVVGDPVYGVGWYRGMGGTDRGWARELERRAGRQFLHAHILAFQHPVTGEALRFEAPLPSDLAALAEWARGSEGMGEGANL